MCDIIYVTICGNRGVLMKITKYKKIILIICVVVAVFFVVSSTEVFAAINSEYSSNDPVSNAGLDSAVNDSDLLDILAHLVYAIGRFIEWLTGMIFTLLTGTSDYPWADK